jgi:hypothetical protein
MKPQNFAERVIWWTLIGTYGFFLIGGLYVVGSVIGWILFGYWLKLLYQQDETTPVEQQIHIPWVIWIWIAGMLMMQVALVIGHFDFNLGTATLIKSSIGWAKGWALLAVFPLMGTLNIRPQLLYRLACIVGLQTLLFFPVFLAFYLLHLPAVPYTSPLKAVGGPGPEFFSPSFYELDPESFSPRWRLFTPWAPALGFMGNVYFFLALQEANQRWRYIGMAGAIFMCVVSVSRLALLSIPVVAIATHILSNFNRPFTLIGFGFVSCAGGIVAPMITEALETFRDRFRAARAASSRVRETLGRIAIERWQNEAPIWGHGIVETGPHLVEFMPIGSHHTWFGLLFVKGLVGLFALAIPLACSFLDLALKAQTSKTAQCGLSMVLILFLYTFGENLEILAYLYYPALLMMGIAFKETVQITQLFRTSGETQNCPSA